MPFSINGTTGLPAGSVDQADLAPNVAGNGPAFRAHATAAQSIPNSTFTKLVLPTEMFDTANCFDNTTNYRFTPNVAGYYQINGQVAHGGSATGAGQISIYKNGAVFATGSGASLGAGIGGLHAVSDLVFMNGTTDYVELLVWQNSGGALNTQAAALGYINYFSGFLARAA